MRLVFDDRALADLEAIYHWIAKDNPTAAKAVIERVFESIEHLATFPRMGPPGATRGRWNGWCRGCPILWCLKSMTHAAKSLWALCSTVRRAVTAATDAGAGRLEFGDLVRCCRNCVIRRNSVIVIP